MPKTKILATLGPASANNKIVSELLLGKTDIFRFNLKHNTLEWHLGILELLKTKANRIGANIATMFDLQGPSLRIGIIENSEGSIDLIKNEKVLLSKTRPEKWKGKWIPFYHVSDIKGLKSGYKIHIADGSIELRALEVRSDSILAKVIEEDKLYSRKNVNIPRADIQLPTLSELDKKHLKAAIENNVDVIALSFVRTKEDVITLRKTIEKYGGKQLIASKIESAKAIENIDEIIDHSDIIVIARGDLGVELPVERIPRSQKEIIRKCRLHSKPVIVATQVLKSMVENPTPTRAEVTDVANAVLDKTDAIWLSEETASGKYPVRAVQTLLKIAKYNQEWRSDGLNEESHHELAEDLTFKPKSFQEVIITASLKFSKKNQFGTEKLAGYIVFTESGKSARFLSKFRPSLPIYAFTQNYGTYKSLILSYGVTSFLLRLQRNPVVNIKHALHTLKHQKIVDNGSKLIVIFGSNVGELEANNSLSIVTA